MSLLMSSTVSPTLAETSAGEITRFSIVISMVAACAGTEVASDSAATVATIHPGVMAVSFTSASHSLQFTGDVFGVLLMALKNLQAGLQQALQLGVAGRRDQRGLQRAVDRLVIGDLVGDIGLVEVGALQFC